LKNKGILIVCFLFCINLGDLYAQSYQLTRHFTTEDGLAGMACRSGFIDSKGYLWVATTNGISRYDGHGFKNFTHDYGDPTSLCWNSTNSFYEDKDGYLWVSTDKGLAQFDYETEQFTCYTHNPEDTTTLSGDRIYGIIEDGSQNLWIRTHSAGFNKFDLKSKTFQRFVIKESDGYSHHDWQNNTVTAIVQDPNKSNILWISAGGAGVYKFEKDKSKITKIDLPNNGGGRTLYIENHFLWIGTWGHGLLQYNTLTDTFQQHDIKIGERNEDKLGFIIDDIKSIGTTKLYIATHSQGVVVLDKNTGIFSFLNPNLERANNESINSITTILIDKKQRLWAFTRAGVLLYDPNAVSLNPLLNIERETGHFDFYGHEIVDIDIDNKGNAWICTYYGDGVYKMNSTRDQVQAIKIDAPRGEENYIILNLLIDQREDIWILNARPTFLLMKYNKEKQRFEYFKKEQLQKLLKGIGRPMYLREDTQGNIWIAVDRGGLIKYEVEKDTFKHFVSWENSETVPDTRVHFRDIMLDSKGNIWLSSDAYGVYMFDIKKEKFTRRILTNTVSRLSGAVNNDMNGLEELPNGKIWVGESYLGIREIDPELPDSQIPKVISFQEGLPDAMIYGIDKDKNGNIWMASLQGLIKYDWTTQQFELFGEKQGIKDIFAWYLLFKTTETGEIFLGKTSGSFYLFNPDELSVNADIPDLVFTDFKVFNQPKTFDKNINYLENINLPYKENFFSISYAALNFTEPEDNQYQYQLVGVDEDWVHSGNQNFATYTNVREGNYIFKVKASNNDNVWNEKGISLQINIAPPWYRSSLAYIFYLFSLGGIIYTIYRFQKRRWQLSANLALEKAEGQRLKEMDLAKNRLYTNITHEFRTPLTVILGLAEEMQLNPKIKWESRLKTIRRNGTQLLDLINQMLDLSRLQDGSLQANYIQGDIIHYLKYLTESYESLAFVQQKNLAFFSDLSQLVMDYDEDKLHRILGNLLSNAIKFTPEYGNIKVFVKKENETLFIQIIDSGVGIAAQKLPHIFDRFYQVDTSSTRQGEGTGIGLALVKEMLHLLDGNIQVESEVGKGSVFEVQLLIRNNATIKNTQKEIELTFTQEGIYTNKIQDNLIPLNKDKPVVLIIEDNWDVVEYLKTCLFPTYTLLTAKDGEEGIAIAQKEIPDIIISDVMMPKMDGFQVCKFIKTNPLTNHIPIILLTAKATQTDKIAGLQYGADAYLSKPFDKIELLTRLKQLITLRKKLQERYSLTSLKPILIESTTEDTFIKELTKIIQAHLEEEDFQVIHLCKIMKISRTQLHRKVKALTDLSTSEFIRQVRLQSAHHLLEHSGLNVSEVAYKVGYKYPNHFSADYKKQFGVPPNETLK